MKSAIAGARYVDLSNGILLAQRNEVVCQDIIPEKRAMLNRKQSPIEDAETEGCVNDKPVNFRAILDKEDPYRVAAYIIIATPTNYFTTQSI